MPYTLTMAAVWLVLAGAAGVVVGYLFRGRTSAVDTRRHPAAHASTTTPLVHTSTAVDELVDLRRQVERLEVQLSITVAERDLLRRQVAADDGQGNGGAS